MTPARVVAAAAAIGTALLLQATLVAPVAGTAAVSLPAVLVAVVALVDGPASGLSLGFAAGLVADLGSDHPAGVLALCWLGTGLAAGLFGQRHRLLRDAVAVAVAAAVAGSAATVVLAIVGAGTSLPSAVTGLPAAAAGDLLLAVLMLPLVRRMLGAQRLRAPQPIARELALGGHRG